MNNHDNSLKVVRQGTNYTDFSDCTPHNIDLNYRFLYFIEIFDKKGNEYRYIGRARDKCRLHEYRRNMLKIQAGKECGKKQNYRAIHLALYRALKNNWIFNFYPLENCTNNEINYLEQQQLSRSVPFFFLYTGLNFIL